MNDSNAAPPLPGALIWRDPRVHLLDDTWLLTVFAVLFATALPWLISGLDIDFGATAAGLLALAAIHVAFAAMSGRSAGKRAARTLAALHALGVVAMAFIWQHAGGLHNPMFLAVFILPVIGAIFLSRWQPYFKAALAAVAVTLVAASEAPELRWYAPGLNAAADWIGGLLSGGRGGGNLPFTGFYAPAEYFVVLLEVFVIVMFACAVAAEYLGTIFDRLHAQVSVARAEAERGQDLWSALMAHLPSPAFLLDAETYEIICASAPALSKFGGEQSSIVGRDLFQVICFSYPEVVQELISGAGGVAKPCMARLEDRLIVTEVRVQHIVQKGQRFALVTVDDSTEAFCVKAALDLAEHAAVVVDSQGRVLAFNKPARALFSALELDQDIAQLLPQSDPSSRWWEPGLSGRRKTHMTVMQRVYQVTLSSLALPGEEARLYVIAFLPLARVAAAEQVAAGSPRLVQQP